MEHTEPTARQDIAIVGLSAIFPGSPNLQGYWHTLVSGKDCIEWKRGSVPFLLVAARLR
ncbi:MAG: Beta-ketoacyl synthase, N-terminal domain [Candidatus Kentron sp. G]|nr:MAG: Beta-ketoacyl synthase, N-terminal domain [Candidatus Kentron sp. G]VFM96729.1 MAG: Beta-ketoacyl synthase, N-terminal domain [Candidatus Kentron sp. G]VFM98912.1 MAG: Beta-ketoacyl synthase, N-terminal domain [Candidatus Kentron sp. G]